MILTPIHLEDTQKNGSIRLIYWQEVKWEDAQSKKLNVSKSRMDWQVIEEEDVVEEANSSIIKKIFI